MPSTPTVTLAESGTTVRPLGRTLGSDEAPYARQGGRPRSMPSTPTMMLAESGTTVCPLGGVTRPPMLVREDWPQACRPPPL